MDFELNHLEIIENKKSIQHVHESSPPVAHPPQSFILNELQKENDELQNKLKLNYRRLLLFEAENNKLTEEKNKFFFEAQNHIEKTKIYEERNTELETENAEYDQRIQLLNEKVYTLDKINHTQLTEIKRFTKFHLKIQNVVKPYIIDLKTKLTSAKKELTEALGQLQHFENLSQNLEQKNKDLREQIQTEQKINQIDKNDLTATYEEQIHSFSKEILDLQNKNELHLKEISRLKKAIEFKNYFENELIKFKRIHEEDQSAYQNLLNQKDSLETRQLEQDEQLARLKIELSQTKNKLEEKECVLEVTRTQLAQQLDESVLINERLLRLEKLNNQLSREMSQTT